MSAGEHDVDWWIGLGKLVLSLGRIGLDEWWGAQIFVYDRSSSAWRTAASSWAILAAAWSA